MICMQPTRLPPAVERNCSDGPDDRTEFQDGGVVRLHGQIAQSTVMVQLRALRLRAGLG